MAEYLRKANVVEAVQWTGENEQDMKVFCPKTGVSTLFDEDGSELQLYFMESGSRIVVQVGDYLIKEDGDYFICPRRWFEKHYDLLNNPYEALVSEAMDQIQEILARHQLNVQLESRWDEDLRYCFISHNEERLEQAAFESIYREIAGVMKDLFYSKHIFDVSFGYSYELSLRTGKIICFHELVEIVAMGNVGLEPRYDIICADCGYFLGRAVLIEDVVKKVSEGDFRVVEGQQHLEDWSDLECQG